MITIGADFQYTMATVGGVMRATGAEMKSLTAIAKKMGETTEWTASQAGDALKFLGMAGFRAAEATEALPGVLDLATAGNLELGRAADIASNALTAMGLPVKELTRVNDVFIGTITRSNTNMEMMAESFKYAAPVAKAYGYDIEKLSGLIGKLGDAGIQGSMAGTQLAMAIQKASKIAEKFGFESSDLVDVLESLRATGMETTKIMDLFGLRAGRAVGVLVDRIPEVRDFQNTLKDVGGEATRLAEVMRKTVKGSFAELKSVVESVAIETFDRLATSIEDTVQSIIAWIRRNKDEMVALFEVMTKSAIAVAIVITKLTGFVSDLASTTREAAGAMDDLTDSVKDLKDQVDTNIDATERYAEAFAKVLFFINEVVLVGPKLLDKLAQSTRSLGDALISVFTGGGPAAIDETSDTLERLEEWLGKVRTGFERATPDWQAWLEFEAFLKSLADESKRTANAINALAESQKAASQATGELTDAQIEFLYSVQRAGEAADIAKHKLKGLTDAQIEFLYSVVRVNETFVEESEKALTGWEIMWLRKFGLYGNAVEEMYRDMGDDFHELTQVMMQQGNRLADGIVDAIYGARLELRKIWQAMARDFITLFVRKILSELASTFAVEFLKILKFFDRAANDRMVMKQGERFVDFFSRGAEMALARMDLAPAMAQMNLTPTISAAPTPGLTASALSPIESNAPRRSDVQVVVNVNAPITSDEFVDWVVHDMAPIIERASELGQTKIALEPFVQTGDPGGVIT